MMVREKVAWSLVTVMAGLILYTFYVGVCVLGIKR